VFWSFRIMVGLGMLMIALGLWSAWLRWRGNLFHSRPFLRFAVAMGPAGILAILAGWFTTEVGRQPWVVYGLMRTKDAVSLHGAPEVGLTLILFVLIYSAVFGTGIAYLLRQVRLGPVTGESATPEDGGPGREKHPMRPLSVVTGPDEDGTGDGKP
jgi:cytochrome d ubiquinol oxidase subunit I